MLSNFIIAAKAVIPTFLLILLGIGGRQFHIMTDTELNHANKAVFEIMFPIMMFYNIYSTDFAGVIIPALYYILCGDAVGCIWTGCSGDSSDRKRKL